MSTAAPQLFFLFPLFLLSQLSLLSMTFSKLILTRVKGWVYILISVPYFLFQVFVDVFDA
jgi:hypothetical protein